MLHMMLLLYENLPTMLPMVGEWRLSLFRAMAVFCNYSAVACEAIVVVSQCNEILLKTALAFTSSLTFYLSAMLRLNTFLSLTLAGVLFSREELERRGRFCCSTWPSSQTIRNNSCSPLLFCGGEGVVNWLKFAQSVLHAMPVLCKCSLSVCVTTLALTHVALSGLSALCKNFRLTVSTIMTSCGCIKPILLTLQSVTSYSTQALGIVWDLSSL